MKFKMENEIYEKLKLFVKKKSYVSSKFVIDRNTTIEDDLGLNGADAIEFIISFGKEFNVDISNFMAADYFEDEGLQFITGLLKKIFSIKDRSRKILTIGHLEKAIIAGKLDESVINNPDGRDGYPT